MVRTDDYLDTKKQRDAAHDQLVAIASQLHRLAYKLEAPEGVRLNELTVTGGSVPDYQTIDRSDLPDWPRLEHAVRAFIAIDRTFHELQASLTPEQQMAQSLSS